MFSPRQFREERVEVMHDLIRSHGFAMVASAAAGKLTADHIPLVLKQADDDADADDCDCGLGRLEGHLSIANPLAKLVDQAVPVLAVFQGPQRYITPSWYPSKQEHGKVVPTWNYMVVHAAGEMRLTNDRDWLLSHVQELTNQYEADREAPWAVTDAPAEFIQKQLGGIIGFTMKITELTGKWKLNQNKNELDRDGVRAGLAMETSEIDAAMLAAMNGERA
ncbi:MAG: FMN-binding negative transcriptional regulator [Alphaproteobacteria bacterium]|nr:FMN-binding negative transcriptional regulator [Alphaproteobacteria bacterium SS10]